MKPATLNLAIRWGLPRPIIKSHAEEKWAWPWARELPKIRRFSIDISATAEASDFKIGVQFGFAKDHHIIHLEKKWARP